MPSFGAAMISASTTISLPRRCAFVLGAVGFTAGFLGPMVLNPESNLGPIIGILITGPGGLIGGAILGILLSALSIGETIRTRILGAVAAVFALSILVVSLPSPEIRGYVIDADVTACELPAQGLATAIAQWQQAVARYPSAVPDPNWIAAATSNVDSDPGVVLTLHVQRKAAIFRHRKPWDRNRNSAGAWIAVDESHRYYANEDGAECAPYLERPRQQYWPAVDGDVAGPKPTNHWPPTDTLNFLRLQSLQPVPVQYQPLLTDQ
jgi:hypothetical protein